MICPQGAVAQAAAALCSDLMTPGRARALGAWAATLPDIATGHIVECRLDGPPGRADYSCALMLSGSGPQRVARAAPAMRVIAAAAPERLRAALSEADVLWLEFDMRPDGAFGAPSLFLAPTRRAAQAPDAAVAARVGADLFAAIWPDRPRPDLAGLLAALPEGLRLRQVGAMAGRPGAAPALRLVLEGATGPDLPDLLRRLGWRGAPEAAERAAGIAARHAPRGRCLVDLDLDAAVGLAPTLAIEVPERALGPVDRLAGDLVRRGLATPAKARALAAVAPRRVVDAPLHIGGAMARLAFGLNHVKLTPSGAGAQGDTAKAYFSLVATPDFSARDASPAQVGASRRG